MIFEFIYISAKCERRGWFRTEDANKPFSSAASKPQEGATQNRSILNPRKLQSLRLPDPCLGRRDLSGRTRNWFKYSSQLLLSRRVGAFWGTNALAQGCLFWSQGPFSSCTYPFIATSRIVFIKDGNHELIHKCNRIQGCDWVRGRRRYNVLHVTQELGLSEWWFWEGAF